MSAVTVHRPTKRAIIRTGHTWYSVSLEWLKANVKSHPMFAEAIEMLEPSATTRMKKILKGAEQ